MFLVALIVFGKVYSSELTYVRAFVHVIVQFTFSSCPVSSVQSSQMIVLKELGRDSWYRSAISACLTVSVARALRYKYMNLYLSEHML